MMEHIENLLPLAVKGSQVPVKQESTAPKSGVESKFELALTQPKIINADRENLTGVLRYAMVIIGLRAQNYPDEVETEILIGFITEHYGGHTPAEIKLAFEMAILRKLDIDPVCYENFSIAYFAGIMEAYRSWAREQVKQLPAPEIKPREFTRQEKLQLDFDYAYILLAQVNKLPCKV